MIYEEATNEELILEYNRLKNVESVNKIMDKALKVRINSAYGFLGNSKTRFYKKEIAEGITLTGQLLLKRINKVSNDLLNGILKNEDYKDYVITQDTDSVVGDTVVYVDGIKVKIEDLYNMYNSYEYSDDFNKSYVKPVNNVQTLSMNNDGEIQHKVIKYIMKHKVTKKMYRITVDDKSVIVTQDHSVIVKRNGRYMSVKPEQIDKKTDKIVKVE